MDQSYESRANAAYYREMTKLARQGLSRPLPSPSATTMEHHQGKAYVVVMNQYETLAVYRIGNNALLRRLKRWPKAVDHFATD